MLMILFVVIPCIAGGAHVFTQDQRYRRIHFNGDEHRHQAVVPELPTFKEEASELNQLHHVLKKKGHSCKGLTYYKRCMKKQNDTEQLGCRMTKCAKCINRDYRQHCPLCTTDKSIFCPALEACSCPYAAGFGLWEECRDRVADKCNKGSLSMKKQVRRRIRKSNHHAEVGTD